MFGSIGITSYQSFGWPLVDVDLQSESSSRSDDPPLETRTWRRWPLAINLMAYVLLLAATAVVVEGRLRRAAWAQVTLADGLWLTFVAAALLACWVQWPAVDALATGFGLTLCRSLAGWRFTDDTMELRDLRLIPLLLGAGCVAYFPAWLATATIRALSPAETKASE
jgi:hypothetical protein